MSTWVLRWETVHPFYRVKAMFDGHKKREILGSDYQKLLAISRNKVVQMYYLEEDLKRKALEAKKLFLDKEAIKEYIHFAEKNAQQLIGLSKKKWSILKIMRKLELLVCSYDLSRPEYVDNIPPSIGYTFPAAETVLDREETEWRIIYAKYHRREEVSHDLKRHAKKFGWMGTAEQEQPWDEYYYRQRLEQKIYPRKQKKILTLIEKLGELRLRLRMAWIESGYLVRGRLPEQPTTYAFLLDGETITFYDEAHLDTVNILITPEVPETTTLRGRAAYPGNVTGKVRIINAWTPDQMKVVMDMKKGEILVTGMTRPHLIQAMHKAAAIVTDEGGVASHAAILCREMKKPCVIGTKIATKIFKNGDTIEVDAEKGIVKKISK